VSVQKESVKFTNLSAKQRDWLSHARPAPVPFSLFLFPGLPTKDNLLNFQLLHPAAAQVITFLPNCVVK